MNSPHYQQWVWDKERWCFVLVCSNCKIVHTHRWLVCPNCGTLLGNACKTPKPIASKCPKFAAMPQAVSAVPGAVIRRRGRPKKVTS